MEGPSRGRPDVVLKSQRQSDAPDVAWLRLLDLVDPSRGLPEAFPVAPAQFDTLRLNLVKLAATIVEKKTRIVMTLPASCPPRGLLRFPYHAIAFTRTSLRPNALHTLKHQPT